MNELTVILFVIGIGLYVIGIMSKKVGINYLCFFTCICSVGQTLTDSTLTDNEQILMVVSIFYPLLMSGWYALIERN